MEAVTDKGLNYYSAASAKQRITYNFICRGLDGRLKLFF